MVTENKFSGNGLIERLYDGLKRQWEWKVGKLWKHKQAIIAIDSHARRKYHE